MTKKEIIDITNKVYQITLFFPKKEPLRYKIRELAGDILKDIICLGISDNNDYSKSRPVENSKNNDSVFDLKKNIEIIKSYFEVAKWQNWVSYFDVLNLEEKYDKIESELFFLLGPENLEKEKKQEKEVLEKPIETSPLSLIEEKGIQSEKKIEAKENTRREKIIELLKEKEKIQVWEVSRIFPDISKRTIRRDFVQLLDMGMIERIGERNETFYKLKQGRTYDTMGRTKIKI